MLKKQVCQLQFQQFDLQLILLLLFGGGDRRRNRTYTITRTCFSCSYNFFSTIYIFRNAFLTTGARIIYNTLLRKNTTCFFFGWWIWLWWIWFYKLVELGFGGFGCGGLGFGGLGGVGTYGLFGD